MFSGQPTIVRYHVTVMGLDSLNEESMVNVFLVISLFLKTGYRNAYNFPLIKRSLCVLTS